MRVRAVGFAGGVSVGAVGVPTAGSLAGVETAGTVIPGTVWAALLPARTFVLARATPAGAIAASASASALTTIPLALIASLCISSWSEHAEICERIGRRWTQLDWRTGARIASVERHIRSQEGWALPFKTATMVGKPGGERRARSTPNTVRRLVVKASS